MRKRLTSLILTFLMVASIFDVVRPIPVEAATSRIISLKNNKTYKNDVNGDKKKDKIRITRKVKNHDLEKFSIKINGKTVYKSSEYVGSTSVKLLTFPGKRPLFFVNNCGEDNDGIRAFYQYRAGKLKCLAKICGQTSRNAYGMHIQGGLTKVSGTKITVRVSECSNMIGGISYRLTYKYTGSKMPPVSRITDIGIMQPYRNGREWTKTLEARRYMKVYKKINSSVKAFTIEPGDDVYFQKVWVGANKLWFKVKANGYIGWMPIVNNPSHADNYFYGCVWYG